MSKDWVLVRLGDFLSELPKSTLPASCSEANGAYAFYCSSSEPKAADTWLQEHPAILMGTGGVASVHLGKGRYAYSTDTWAIRIKESSKLTQPYAYRVLELSLPKIDYAGFEGSGLRHLRKSYIKDFRFLAPSHSAPQERIVSILTGIDTAIEKTEALIAKYQQIKAGLMHDLFTRGVLPNGQLRPSREQAPELYQETVIGWIPREWNKSDCSLEFAIESGITLGQHRRPSKRPRAYLRVANVHRDELRLEDLAYLEVLPNESVPTLQEFDLLIVEGHANRAEIGRCAMITAEAAGLLFQNHLFRLRTHRLNHYYALDWLNSHYAMRHWETMCSTSSGLNTINRRMLGRMFVAVPSPHEQVLIAQKTLGAKKRLGLEVQRLHKLRAQKSGLMHDLLTGKVPVTIENRTTTTEAVI